MKSEFPDFERAHAYCHGETWIWISPRYREARRLVHAIGDFLEASPPFLTALGPKHIFVSHAPYGNGSPHPAGCAYPQHGTLIFFRYAETEKATITSPATLLHELAHLADVNGGPPDMKTWLAAIASDFRHQKDLKADPEIAVPMKAISADGFMCHRYMLQTRKKALANVIEEDWADAVALFCMSLTAKGMYGVPFSFFYPARAAILESLVSQRG